MCGGLPVEGGCCRGGGGGVGGLRGRWEWGGMGKMERFSTAFVFVLLLGATGIMGPMLVEGRTCEAHSRKFKGHCHSKSNCASVCQTEGFQGGHCHGIRRRCFCTKHC
ncbi:defensin Ec-AMP-D2-like [Pyrus ussuriensis x Pyrus communis]|uniref:Defensin Ec-AMP-D2-like n=1 Tax=Pyrus ussuriensis x Pyrus communis TaxID=2448454 RepID=A0A5N5HD13_9ROSA|nr:defensin Ec-AMP-D2-like [Pyrus ussuriensis x Pyrus communis]